MPKLPCLSGDAVIGILKNRFNFHYVRQKGSHVILKKIDDEAIQCVVPLHDELKKGTLRGILRMARVTPDEFLEEV